MVILCGRICNASLFRYAFPDVAALYQYYILSRNLPGSSSITTMSLTTDFIDFGGAPGIQGGCTGTPSSETSPGTSEPSSAILTAGPHKRSVFEEWKSFTQTSTTLPRCCIDRRASYLQRHRYLGRYVG